MPTTTRTTTAANTTGTVALETLATVHPPLFSSSFPYQSQFFLPGETNLKKKAPTRGLIFGFPLLASHFSPGRLDRQ